MGDVKQKYEQRYRDWRDTYRPVCEDVVTIHREGLERQDLTCAVGKVYSDVAKHVDACILGYERWMGRRKFSWVSSSKGARWVSGGLRSGTLPEHLGWPEKANRSVRS